MKQPTGTLRCKLDPRQLRRRGRLQRQPICGRPLDPTACAGDNRCQAFDSLTAPPLGHPDRTGVVTHVPQRGSQRATFRPLGTIRCPPSYASCSQSRSREAALRRLATDLYPALIPDRSFCSNRGDRFVTRGGCGARWFVHRRSSSGWIGADSRGPGILCFHATVAEYCQCGEE
jgi:hypothetical protein